MRKVRILRPYNIEVFVGIVTDSGPMMEWFLYEADGKLVKQGCSRHSDRHSIAQQAMENCTVAARKVARINNPILFVKTRFDPKYGDGKQQNLLPGGEKDAQK